ncbi:hypothetical protein O8C52_20860 [Agrobacterium rhizogenes]|nr:hypothetical protein [Agrobacterium sp. ST15.13.015]MCZ7501992.1 hypothetical protein [Rhizobium rhizogenes]
MMDGDGSGTSGSSLFFRFEFSKVNPSPARIDGRAPFARRLFPIDAANPALVRRTNGLVGHVLGMAGLSEVQKGVIALDEVTMVHLNVWHDSRFMEYSQPVSLISNPIDHYTDVP